MENARDARRRKLLERGNDRLAFITGQTQSVPDTSSPPPPTPKDGYLQASAPVASVSEADVTGSQISDPSRSNKDASGTARRRGQIRRSNAISKSQILDELFVNEKEDDISICESGNGPEVKAPQSDRNSELLSTAVAQMSSDQFMDTTVLGNEAKVKVLQSDTNSKLLSTAVDQMSSEVKPLQSDRNSKSLSTAVDQMSSEVKPLQNDRNSKSLSTAMARMSSDQVMDTVVSKARQNKLLFFSSKQISQSVSASEDIRLLCAVIIALLVILSNYVSVLGGAVLTSIINFRPLFLVMLTDLTIIVGLLMTTKQRTDEKEKQKERAKIRKEDDGWAGNLGDTLETCLIIQKLTSAVFMDCIICAVLMISGICF